MIVGFFNLKSSFQSQSWLSVRAYATHFLLLFFPAHPTIHPQLNNQLTRRPSQVLVRQSGSWWWWWWWCLPGQSLERERAKRLEEEYADMRFRSDQYSTVIAEAPHNAPKNRYRSILPCKYNTLTLHLSTHHTTQYRHSSSYWNALSATLPLHCMSLHWRSLASH